MSKTYHKKDQKKLDLIVLPKNKFQKNTNNFSQNNRYQNLPNKKVTYNQANSYNPYIYASFNKKGNNVDPSISGNNILVINNSDINLYQNLKNGKSKEKMFLNKSGNTNIEIIPKSQIQPNTSENRGHFNLGNVLQSKSKTFFSPSTESSSRWNNIGFKEVRYKNNLGMLSYDQINRNILKSQNMNILNDNIFSSYNPYFNNRNSNMSYSTNIYEQNSSPIQNMFNNIQNQNQNQNRNRNKVYKNLLMNQNAFGKGKELLNSYKSNLSNYKTPEHINTLEKSGAHGKSSKVGVGVGGGLNNKSSLSKNNPYMTYMSYNKNLVSDDRRKTAPRKTDYDYDINNNKMDKKMNKKTFLKYNDDINNNKSLNNKQYYAYKLYNKNKNANTNINMKSKPLHKIENNKNIPSEQYEKYIKSICKIQSMWRGAYVRELMTYYWCLSKFKDLLDLIMMNHVKKNFFNYIRLIKNRKDKLVKLSGTSLNSTNNSNNNKIKKDYEILKNNFSKKEEDYNKLMKNYNSIVKKCDELNKINQEIKDNNINIKDKNIDKPKTFVIDRTNNNFEIINNIKKLKKFFNIKKEQKDEINIISNENNENDDDEKTGIKLRGKRPNKSKDNNIKDYIDYVNNFKSKLNVINNEQLIIEPEINEINEENEDKKEKKPIDYQISNYNLTLIKKNKIEIPKINEIFYGEQINLINDSNRPEAILEKDLIYKSNNENMSNSSTKDLKDKENENIKSERNNNYSIEQQKNDINIINIKRQNEFDKELLSENNDILLNIISETPQNQNKNENNEEYEEKQSSSDKKNLEIFENERISFITANKNENKNENEKKKANSELKIFNNENILFLKESNKYDKNLIMNNTNNIDYEGKVVEKCDKITEISNDLIKLEPDNHSEIIFSGIKNNKKNTDNPNLKYDINKNYNIVNEVEKADALEINPFEMRRTQNNTENIFISNADKMEFLNNKESIYNDKAKKNMMKIILPIRIKKILKEWIKSNIFKLLINNLKKIAFMSHILLVDQKYKNKSKKYAFEKLKDNSRIIKYKNYFMKELMKSRMKKFVRDYIMFKWNLSLIELSKLIIANKSLIKNGNK